MPYTYLQVLGYLAHHNKADSETQTTRSERTDDSRLTRTERCKLRLYNAKTCKGRTLLVFKCAGSRRGGNLDGRNWPCGSPACKLCSKFIGRRIQTTTRQYVVRADQKIDIWVDDFEKSCPGLENTRHRELWPSQDRSVARVHASTGEPTSSSQTGESRGIVAAGAPVRRRLKLTVRKPKLPKVHARKYSGRHGQRRTGSSETDARGRSQS